MNATILLNSNTKKILKPTHEVYMKDNSINAALQKSCCLRWTSRFWWTTFKALILIQFFNTVFDVFNEQVSQNYTNDLNKII